MKKVLGAAVIVYLGCFAVLWAMRLDLIYPFDQTHVPLTDTTLENVVEKELHTPDGETLIIWVAPAPKNAPTVVYFSGNAGNLGNRVNRLQRIQTWGFGFVALGYRGSSGSSGKPSEAALSKDAVQLWQSLPDLLGRSPSGPIIYYGESLGTGVASKLASTHAPDGMILESPYTSIAELAAQQMPMFPVSTVLDEVWDSETYITSVTAPLLVIHGTDDRTIPYAMGQRIFDLAPSKDKKLITVQGGGHSNLWTSQTQRAIYDFLKRQ